MAQVTNSKLAINIVVGVACMLISMVSMAVLAFTFSVANRLFVSDELLSGWHAAWSNPLILAAVSTVGWSAVSVRLALIVSRKEEKIRQRAKSSEVTTIGPVIT